MQRYGAEKGKSFYYAWLNKRHLDDTKPYSQEQIKKESFSWAKPLIKFFKQDKEAKYYQVLAHFPVSSMNRNVYSKDELLNAGHTLPGQHVDLNHNLNWVIDGVDIMDAQFEDGAVETMLRVPNWAVDAKGRNVQQTIDSGEIDHVSIEADAPESYETEDGIQVKGLAYTGLALLDQDSLPGIPLTRLMPLESLRESIFAEVENQTLKEDNEKMSEAQKQEQTVPEQPEKLEQEVDALKKLADEKQANVDSQKEIDKLTEDLRKTSDELNDAKAEVAKLKKAKTQSESRITNVFEKIQQEKDERIDALEKANKALEEKSADFEAKNAGLLEKSNSYLKQLKDESEKRATADQRAVNEMKETNKVKEENADFAQENADLTRKMSENTQKIADLSKKLYAAEKELSDIKEHFGGSQKTIEQALKETKRLHKILKKHGIYEVDDKGNLIIPQ